MSKPSGTGVVIGSFVSVDLELTATYFQTAPTCDSRPFNGIPRAAGYPTTPPFLLFFEEGAPDLAMGFRHGRDHFQRHQRASRDR